MQNIKFLISTGDFLNFKDNFKENYFRNSRIFTNAIIQYQLRLKIIISLFSGWGIYLLFSLLLNEKSFFNQSYQILYTILFAIIVFCVVVFVFAIDFYKKGNVNGIINLYVIDNEIDIDEVSIKITYNLKKEIRYLWNKDVKDAKLSHYGIIIQLNNGMSILLPKRIFESQNMMLDYFTEVRKKINSQIGMV